MEFDPVGGVWTAIGNLPNAWAASAGGVLPDGSVIIAGGHDAVTTFNSSAIYTPASGT